MGWEGEERVREEKRGEGEGGGKGRGREVNSLQLSVRIMKGESGGHDNGHPPVFYQQTRAKEDGGHPHITPL